MDWDETNADDTKTLSNRFKDLLHGGALSDEEKRQLSQAMLEIIYQQHEETTQ